jgi:uncharacterized protein YyaL (SSP411 family)
MTPDKRPFYAATYIPRVSVYGRVGMLELIPRVAAIWHTEREKVFATTEQVLSGLQKLESRQSGGSIDSKIVDEAFRQLGGRYDATRGGFGAAPKFPSPHNLVFLTRYWRSSGNRLALDIVENTLEHMHLGGIHDQVGFGFHRYSTDAEWLVPHFEKMLYDQALMTMASTEAWLASGNPVFERIVRETLTYVLRDMTAPSGGFYSAEDADSEGEEGLFYVWTLDEVQEVLGEEDGEFAARVWSLSSEGNFADEATRQRTGRNIPHLRRNHSEVAASLGLDQETFDTRLEKVRRLLFDHREKRIHPLKDDKVLTDWNGLMAAAMAAAGRAFDEPNWISAARRATSFVLDQMRDPGGRLLHRYRDGDASIPAFLDDYVFMTTAMIELFEATQEARYLVTAIELQRQTDELFSDGERGGYFFSAADNEQLLVRQKEVYDGAIPSGNSTAAENLVRLARLTGRNEFQESADRVISAFASEIMRQPSAHCHMISALQRRVGRSIEVVIVGDPAGTDTRTLVDTVRSQYLPNAAILVVAPGDAGTGIRELAPFVQSYEMVDGRAAAYVCRDFQCKLPTTDPAKLAEMLEEASKTGTES